MKREANKPALGQEIWKRLNNDDVQVNNRKHVLDGGYLIHKLKWYKGETFKDIYNDYIINNYGQGTVVVFVLMVIHTLRQRKIRCIYEEGHVRVQDQ